MSDEKFINEVKKRTDKLLSKVVMDEKVALRIVGLLLAIKESRFDNAEPPKGILFYGPPGTGKTEFMRHISEALSDNKDRIPRHIIRGPELISQYYGKSEARLRKIFRTAEREAEEHNISLIFIDELDSLAPRRDKTHGDLEQRMVGQLLALMDGLEKSERNGHVVVIGSTNMPNSIDPALRRPGRFDMEFEFDLPNKEMRERILKIHLGMYNNDISKRILNIVESDLENIAKITEGFSGADLKRLITETMVEKTISPHPNKSDFELMREVKKRIIPSGMREYVVFEPEEPRFEFEDAKSIAERFIEDKSGFLSVLLKGKNADEMVNAISYYVKNKCADLVFLRFTGTRFRSRWFGETEESIRYMFDKIRRQNSVVFIKGIDTIADPDVEQLRGAYAEFEDSIYLLKKEHSKVLIIASIVDKKNEEKIKNLFPDGLVEVIPLQ